MGYGSFYECFGKMILSTEAQLRRRVSRRRRKSFSNYNSDSKMSISNSKYIDMLKNEIELENKDITATKFYRSFPETLPALLRPLPLSRRRGDTRQKKRPMRGVAPERERACFLGCTVALLLLKYPGRILSFPGLFFFCVWPGYDQRNTISETV